MITVTKVGYQNELLVIPKVPEEWIRAQSECLLIGVVSGIASGAAGAMIHYGLTKKRKAQRRRKSS